MRRSEDFMDVRLLNASCALNLYPVTLENCHHFYYKTSLTKVLRFNNFGYNLRFHSEITAITYIKIDQNYSKYIFNKSIIYNLQPSKKNENNFKYYWIILSLLLCLYYFYTNNFTTEGRKCFFLLFLFSLP